MAMKVMDKNEFEKSKNRRAFIYTCVVFGSFLLFSVLYTWSLSAPERPDDMDLIEINLGNDQEGLGDVQPLVPGDMAPENQSITSAESGMRVNDAPANQIKADENGDPDAAPVVRADHPKKDSKDFTRESHAQTAKAVNPGNISNPNPAPPKPKTLYKGGNGSGGNNAQEDNGYRNQGYTGTTGDMGSPNGNPDSYGNSPGGRSGISVSRGLNGRRIISFPDMKGDFNENAKVYVDVVVNGAGKVISATVGRGTTTSNASLRNIATTKAKTLKFNPTSTGNNETGTLLFNFVLEN